LVTIDTLTAPQPILTHEPDSPEGFSDDQEHEDAKAFGELQKYADFQRVLSERIHESIVGQEEYTATGPTLFLEKEPVFGQLFSHISYIHQVFPELLNKRKLPGPVIIQQRNSKDGLRWIRSYAPALVEYGIGENAFLNIIDSLNEASKVFWVNI